MTQDEVPNSVCVTQRYVSPEILSVHSALKSNYCGLSTLEDLYVTKLLFKSDIWALGIICLTLVTGIFTVDRFFATIAGGPPQDKAIIYRIIKRMRNKTDEDSFLAWVSHRSTFRNSRTFDDHTFLYEVLQEVTNSGELGKKLNVLLDSSLKFDPRDRGEVVELCESDWVTSCPGFDVNEKLSSINPEGLQIISSMLHSSGVGNLEAISMELENSTATVENSFDREMDYLRAGDICMSNKRHEEAYVYQEKALAMIHRLYGRTSRESLQTCVRIGRRCSKYGLYHKALHFYDIALKISNFSQALDTEEFICLYELTGDIHLRNEEYSKAIQEFSESCGCIYEKKGNGHCYCEMLQFNC